MMIRCMWIGTIAALALAAAAPGCTQPDTQDDSAALTAAHEMHGPPGPELIVQAALRHLDLTAEQRSAIEDAARTLRPAAALHHALLADVAAGVRAGQIDEAKLSATLDRVAAPADRAASLAHALDTLHATLTADQRRALVELIGKHLDEHQAASGAMHGGASAMIEHLLSGLDLTGEQRATIDALAAKESEHSHSSKAGDAEAAHAALRAQFETFASDRFDGAAFAAAVSGTPFDPRDHIQHALHLLAGIVPVLTPAQREALATRIESMPMAGG